MNDPNELVRTLEADEIAALGPLPDSDVESPTTDRHDHTAESTAEAHAAGVLSSSAGAVDDNDPFPPPRSMTEEQ